MTSYFLHPNDHDGQKQTVKVHICRPDDVEGVIAGLSPVQSTFLKARNFAGEAGQRAQIPGSGGEIESVVFGAGSIENDMLGAVRLGGLSASLPAGLYELTTLPTDWESDKAAIGWGLGSYKFDRYLKDKRVHPTLLLSGDLSADEVTALTKSIHLGRDLINTPAGDMGPEALEAEATTMATEHGAQVKVIEGEALLKENYPMIHAVGRAAHEAPRLVHITWGDPSHKSLTLVGKGITFDTGGLNIKGAAGARLMKKDMGGAAHAIALANMIMANKLPVHLSVFLAIAENAISANAYRPGDVLTSRLGLTVEIDNTDAEGRLVLGDALTRATEDEPDLIIDFATLTGAARVALGPTLPPYFSNRQNVVQDIVAVSEEQHDPLWPMPLWKPYLSYLSSPIADMKNAGGSFAGCMTAALFLERFVKERPWMHLDVYGWNPAGLPGHPKGGEMFALRTLYHWIKDGGLDSDFSA